MINFFNHRKQHCGLWLVFPSALYKNGARLYV